MSQNVTSTTKAWEYHFRVMSHGTIFNDKILCSLGEGSLPSHNISETCHIFGVASTEDPDFWVKIGVRSRSSGSILEQTRAFWGSF